MLQGKYKGINSLTDDFITFDGMFDKATTNGEIKVLKKHYMLKLENNANYLKNDDE